MQADARPTLTRLYRLVAKMPLGAYLSSGAFMAFCRDHDLTDTWKEHFESSKDRPDLYGNEATQEAFILFFDHLLRTRPSEFIGLLVAFLQNLAEWSEAPVPVARIQQECLRLGFPAETVKEGFRKRRKA